MSEPENILQYNPGYVAMSCLDHTKNLHYALCSAVAYITRDKWAHWLAENELDITGLTQPIKSQDEEEFHSEICLLLNSVYKADFHRCIEHPMGTESIRDRLTHSYARHPTGIGGQRAGDFAYGMYFQNEIANFVVASSFVRLLGAWEQFEIDALRCLFYFRPGGMLGNASDNELIVVDEERYNNDFTPIGKCEGIWNWMQKHAENRVDRAKIISRVFGIDLNEGMSKNDHSRVKDWYDKRNNIAHGRGDSTVSFAQYIAADAFIFSRVLRFSRQCRDKQMVCL